MILFHGKRHPQEMGTAEIASTQNQAFSAILFLLKHKPKCMASSR